MIAAQHNHNGFALRHHYQGFHLASCWHAKFLEIINRVNLRRGKFLNDKARVIVVHRLEYTGCNLEIGSITPARDCYPIFTSLAECYEFFAGTATHRTVISTRHHKLETTTLEDFSVRGFVRVELRV